MRRAARLVLRVLALGLVIVTGCGEAGGGEGGGGEAPPSLELDVQRRSGALSLSHREHGEERAALEIRIANHRITMTARFASGPRGTLELLATPAGAPVSGRVLAALGSDEERVVLEVQNGRAVLPGGERPALGDPVEREPLRAALRGSPALPLFAALAPYREAVLARLAEAAPLYVVIALYRAWPEGVEPAWPTLIDPRDAAPTGLIEGDRVGLGMTCSPQIRCPGAAPFCVSRDHAVPAGFCTRACGSDADCGANARCALVVVDVPEVSEPVTMCRIDCDAGACPALLVCSGESDAQCWPPLDR